MISAMTPLSQPNPQNRGNLRLLEALGWLYSVTTGVLKSIIIQLLHDETEADDALQEVFLQVWDRSPSYCPGKSDELAPHARKTTRD